MKQYLLFTFDGYYPSGGMNDYCGAYNTLEEAFSAAKSRRKDYYHIFDIETFEVITEDYREQLDQ